MNAISARVLVMTVVPHETRGTASKQPITNARPAASPPGRQPNGALIWHIVSHIAFISLLVARVSERGATDATAQ
jgi:hypothetical protein